MIFRLSMIFFLVCSMNASALFFKKDDIKFVTKTTIAILPPENLPDVLDYFRQDSFLNAVLEKLYTKPYFRVLEFKSLPEVVGDATLFANGFQKEPYLKVVKELGAEYLLILNVEVLSDSHNEEGTERYIDVSLEGRMVRFLTGEIMAISKVKLRCVMDRLNESVSNQVRIKKLDKKLKSFTGHIHDDFKNRMLVLQSAYREEI